jgi:hypothetical protein
MIVFENDGEIDIRALTTMGVNVKEGNAFGYFGTGLKYAMSVLISSGHEMVVCIGENVLEINSSSEIIRGEEFNIMTVDGSAMGFTSDLGKNWTVKDAFRELACNAMDEGGSYHDGDVPEPQEGRTVIVVKGEGIEEAYQDRDDIFFSSVAEVFDGDVLDCAEENSWSVYYQGVKVYEIASLFKYNIHRGITLTEDRTARHHWELDDAIADYILSEAPAHIVEAAVSCSDSAMLENNLHYESNNVKVSQTFIDVVKERVDNKDFVVQSARSLLREMGILKKTREISTADESDQQRLENALKDILKHTTLTEDTEIYVVEDEEDTRMVEFADDGNVYVTEQILDDEIPTILLYEWYLQEGGFVRGTTSFEMALIRKLLAR